MPYSQHVLFLHGALGCAELFAPVVSELDSRLVTHVINFEGHGDRNGEGREFRIQHFAENVVSYMDEQGISTADIFGYSMGGYVALYLASIMPDRVRSIVTLATKFMWNPESAAREASMLDVDGMLENVPAFAAELERRHTAIGWRNVVEQTRELLLHLGDVPLLTPQTLAGVQCPVRIMIGDRDAMVGIDESLNTYRSLTNGEFAVLPGTKHPLSKVDPSILAWHLRDFFIPEQ